MYQNYIFDLYGTLIDIKTDEYSDVFWRKASVIFESRGAKWEPSALRKAYLRYSYKEKRKVILKHPFYSKVDIKIEKVFRRLFSEKGVTLSDREINEVAWEFREASTLFIRLYDGVIDLLDSLVSSNKKIYLLSNAQRCFTYPELKKLGLVDYFDGIFISSDCACSKPSKTFFNKLINEYRLDKSQTIMIGNDCRADIHGAHDAGIDSLYIHQEISSPINEQLLSKWSIMDGDVYKIKQYVL